MSIRNRLKSGVAPHPLATDPAAAANRRTFTQDREAARWTLSRPTLARWAAQPLHFFRTNMNLYNFRFHVTPAPEDAVGHGVCFGPTGAGMTTRLHIIDEANLVLFPKKGAGAMI